ncbi:hypothetical protein V2O64_06075 [Verrucomicrobiaceae bacterium 227]
MKNIYYLTLSGIFGMLVTSCTTSTRPVGNVEGLERQTPVTQDPNAIGDALNARNAIDYSNGNSYGRQRYGY